jgi:multicomponent Na+:H+ antiporter subunit D
VIGIEVFEQLPIRNILLVLGLMGMVAGSVSAMRANNINRMVAFSSAAQIGYIYMGIGIGGKVGYTAAMFHVMAHAVTKSTLFLTTPRLSDVSGGSLLFRNLQGSGIRDRAAGVYFSVASLSMIGIPIFAGFSSKLLFAEAAVDSGSMTKMVLVMIALALSSMLNAIYFIRTMIRIYQPDTTGIRVSAKRVSYQIPMIILTVMNLALGLFSWYFAGMIEQGLSMFG